MGFGGTNVAVLRRLGSGASSGSDSQPSSQPETADPPSDPAPETNGSGSEPATSVSEPAPLDEPPQIPVVDESAARGADHVFDLAIVGGRVIDPASGFDSLATIGISGSTVAAIVAGPDTVEGRVARSPDGFTDQQPAGRGLRSDIGAV